MQKRQPLTKLLPAALICAAVLSPAGAAETKNEITVAVASTFTTMDPWNATDTLSQAVAKSFYEGLFKFDRAMNVVPSLAESAESSPDGMQHVVHLRRGVKFHDGTTFTAEAVKANFDRITTPGSTLKRFFLFENVASLKVLDPYTVRFTLKRPNSAFINRLAHPSAVMICPKSLSEKEVSIAFHPCGTGPFVMKNYNPSDVLRVEKNPNYWRAGYPKLDAITWRPVVENSTRVAMALTGEADYAFPLPSEQVKMVKDKGTLRVDVTPSIMLRFVEMNLTKPVFKDVRVRQALNYAVNKEALVKVAFAGYADVAEGIAPLSVDYAVKLGPWPYDPQKAKALLKEAGYPNGFEVELWSGYNHTTASKIIQFLQQQLAQVGVKSNIRALEAGQRTALVESVPTPDKSQHDLYYIGWSSSTGELDYAIRPLLASENMPPVGSNEAYYKSEKVDRLIQEGLATTDRTKKAAIYKEMQEQLWADMPWIPLVTEKNIAASAKNLTGFYIQPDGGYNFYQAELK